MRWTISHSVFRFRKTKAKLGVMGSVVMMAMMATVMRVALCEYRRRKQQEGGEHQQLLHNHKSINPHGCY